MKFFKKYNYKPISVEPTKAFSEKTTLFLPLLKIRMVVPKKHININALIDSGAEVCMFSHEIANHIGIKKIRNKKYTRICGITGKSIKVYFHDVKIEVEGHRFNCYVGFTKKKSVPALLGQDGFFCHYKVEFDYPHKTFSLSR